MAISFRQDAETVDKCLVSESGDPNSNLTSVVCHELGLKTLAANEFVRMALINALLFDRKQQDYGSRNITDFGLYGCVMKMNDKMERLKHLIAKGRKKKVQNEAIIDSLRDLSNYAIIGLVVDQGRFPNE